MPILPLISGFAPSGGGLPIDIATGRDRTLVYEGNILCPYASTWAVVTNPEDGLEGLQSVSGKVGEVLIEGAWFRLEFWYELEVLTDPLPPFIPPPASPIDVRLHRFARARIMDPDKLTTYADSGIQTSTEDWEWPGSINYDGEGTWEANCPVVERLTADALDGSLTDADGFPLEPVMVTPEDQRIDYYGSAQEDGLPGLHARYYEDMDSTGNLTASITVDGLTASVTYALPGSLWEFGLPLYGCRMKATAYGENLTCVTSIDGRFCDQENLGAPIVWSQGNRYASFEDGALARSGSTVSITADGTLWPPCRANFEGKAYSFESNYPANPLWRWQNRRKADGEVDVPTFDRPATVEQRRWDVSVYDITPTIYLESARDEFAPHRVWLDVADLGAKGEDVRDWRTMIRGKLVNVEAAGWNQAVRIDEGDPANWTAGSNTTKGGITSTTLAASGGTGSGSRTWSPETILEPYRYMALRIRSVVNGSVPLTIGMHGETWDIETGAANTFSEVLIDLCCSSSETDDVEPKDSRFPIDGPADPTAELTQDPYKLGWGVDWVDTLTISGIPDGETIEVDWIEVRQEIEEDVYFGFLCPFKKRVTGWVSPSDTTYLMPYWYVTVDGRISDIGVHGAFVDANTGADTYAWYDVDDIITWLGYLPGYIGTPETFTDDGYHNRSLQALHLCGAGVTINHGVVSRWQNWAKEVADQTLPIQALWDQVDSYPGIGRGCFTGEDYASNLTQIPIRVAVHLRGKFEGIVFDESGLALKDQHVTTDPDGGSDITDFWGRYASGNPWALGNDSYDVEWNGLAQTDTQANRWRNRTGFRKDPVAEEIASTDYAVSRSQRHALAGIDAGNVSLRFAFNWPRPLSWSTVSTSIAADLARIAYPKAGEEKLALLTASSSSVSLRFTSDEGGTYTMAITIGAGDFGDLCYTDNNLLYVFRLNSSGTVYMRLYDGEGNAIGSETATNLTGLDQAGIAVEASRDSDGRLTLGCTHTVGGNQIFKQSFDGITFS